MANSPGSGYHASGPQQPNPYQPDPYRPEPYQPEPYQPGPYQPDAYQPDTYQQGPRRPGEYGTDVRPERGYRSGGHRTGSGGQASGSGSHRRRKKKSNAGRVGLAVALAVILGIAAVAVIVLFQHGKGPKTTHAGSGPGAGGGSVVRVAAPRTGPVLSISTPDPYSYGIGAVSGGTTDQPLTKDGTPPPSGGTYAYIDYVLTNSGRQPALLDLTAADLFVKKAKVPDSAQGRCMPQPGVPDDMCTLPNNGAVIGLLAGSKPLTSQKGGDQYLAPGASCLVRVETGFPVNKDTVQADMNLFVWQARYIANRKAVPVAFPH